MNNKNEPTWYLLYGGTSEDGRGMGRYEGRTTDVNAALKFRKKLDKQGPYSIGYVTAVTDSSMLELNTEQLKKIKEAGDKT